MPAETPQGAVGKDAPSSLSEALKQRVKGAIPEKLAQLVTEYHVRAEKASAAAIANGLERDAARDALETTETQLAEARAEIERLRGALREIRDANVVGNSFSKSIAVNTLDPLDHIEEIEQDAYRAALLDSGSKENEEGGA